MKIVIPGGSGQVGRILARYFHSTGHEVIVLSREPQPAPWRMVPWDGVTTGPWVAELEQSDLCINLTGRSVDCRHTAKNRRAIYKSRIQSTHLLNEVIASLAQPPRLWINASTATIYRHAQDRPMDEATGELGGNESGAPDTWNFSIDVAKGWEEAFFSASTPFTDKICSSSVPNVLFQRAIRNCITCASVVVYIQEAGGLSAGGYGAPMTSRDVYPPNLEFVPLQNAMLCVDCESVTATRHDTCPVCGGHSLLGLARILGGRLAAHKASNCTTTDYKSGIARSLLFNAEVAIGLNRVSAAEFSAIVGGIASVMTPALEKDVASFHVDVEPFSKRRPARQERVA